MKIQLPRVLKIDRKTERNDRIQQLSSISRWVDGRFVPFTKDKLKGWLFQPQAGGPDILVVPAKTKNLPDNGAHIIACDGVVNGEEIDASKGTWVRHPVSVMHAASEQLSHDIQDVLNSWINAFSYVQEDPSRQISGLRAPQIGALHAIHAHWSW